MSNRENAYINVRAHLDDAEAFLKRLAAHLKDNGMMGEAYNCTIHARRLEGAKTSLEFLRRKEAGE